MRRQYQRAPDRGMHSKRSTHQEGGTMQLSSVGMVFCVATALTVANACTVDARDEVTQTRSESLAEAPRRGVWVYGVNALLNTATGADDFMDFARAFGINNVYLSIGNGLLANPRLPGFLD